MATYDLDLGPNADIPGEATIQNFKGQLRFTYEYREVDPDNPVRNIGLGHFPGGQSIWAPRQVVAAYVDHIGNAVPFQVGQTLNKPDWAGKEVKLVWDVVPGWSGYFIEDMPGEDSVKFL